MAEERVQRIPVDLIRRSRHQPRREFDADKLDELAASMQRDEQIQPITVRRGDDGYELLAGERRWRAAQRAGLDRIDAIVRDVSEAQAARIAIVENVQREDLNPIEEARALQAYMHDYGLSQSRAAEDLGLKRVKVAQSVRLLQLDTEVQEMLIRGDLSEGAARPLVVCPSFQQVGLARHAVRYQWTARTIEQKVREQRQGGGSGQASQASPEDRYSEWLGGRLSEALGCPTRIRGSPEKGYSLEIRAATADVLTGVLERLGLSPDDLE